MDHSNREIRVLEEISKLTVTGSGLNIILLHTASEILFPSLNSGFPTCRHDLLSHYQHV